VLLIHAVRIAILQAFNFTHKAEKVQRIFLRQCISGSFIDGNTGAEWRATWLYWYNDASILTKVIEEIHDGNTSSSRDRSPARAAGQAYRAQ
jgi:hypothetical protein